MHAPSPLPRYDEIDARFFRPQRARLAEARACVAGASGPDEAWARLHACGLIPATWLRDEARLFRLSHKRGVRRRERAAVPAAELRMVHVESSAQVAVAAARIPPHARDAALYAADVPGITAAEALARECVARWAPWVERPRIFGADERSWRAQFDAPRARAVAVDASGPRAVVWRVRGELPSVPLAPWGLASALEAAGLVRYGPLEAQASVPYRYHTGWSQGWRWFVYHHRPDARKLRRAASNAWWPYRPPLGSPRPPYVPPSPPPGVPFEDSQRGRALYRAAFTVRDAAEAWRAVVADDPNQTLRTLLRRRGKVPPALADQPLGAIPNPFEPALALYMLGYVPVDWTASTVVLEAPTEP